MKKNWLFALSAVTLLSGCATNMPETPAEVPPAAQEETTEAPVNATFDYDPFPNKSGETTEFSLTPAITAKLTPFDQLTAFDETNCFYIKLNGSDVEVHIGLNDSSLDAATEQDRILQSMEIKDNRICITREGTYVLEGSLTDGQIYVDAAETEKVQLVLHGVQINCNTSCPIYIASADKALITIAEGTDNQLTDTINSSEDAKGCIFSDCDLTINGSGNLKIDGSFNNGISSKDDLKIVGGNITVNAINNGLKGNDSVAIYGGNIEVTSIGDGIKTDSEDESKGYLYFYEGTVRVTADDDALQAVSAIFVRDASVSVRAYDAAINCDGVLDGVEKITEIK